MAKLYFEELPSLEVECSLLSGKGDGKKKGSARPEARGGATLSFVEQTNSLVLLGGADRQGRQYGFHGSQGAWEFSLASGKWSVLKTANDEEKQGDIPLPRSGHCATVLGTKIYITGGMQASAAASEPETASSNDVYVFDIQSRLWQKVPITNEGDAPAGTNEHRTVGRIVEGTGERLIYIFGGSVADQGPSSTLSILNVTGDAAMWNPVQGISGPVPQAREMHGTFVSEGGKCMTIYGGRSMTGLLADACTLDLEKMEWRTPVQSKLGVCGHSAFNVNGNVGIFGGFTGTDFAESFMTLGDDGTWTQATLAPYTPEKRFALASCQGPDATLYCFGGSGQSGEIADLFKIALPAAT